jgi:hypothetical protein
MMLSAMQWNRLKPNRLNPQVINFKQLSIASLEVRRKSLFIINIALDFKAVASHPQIRLIE